MDQNIGRIGSGGLRKRELLIVPPEERLEVGDQIIIEIKRVVLLLWFPPNLPAKALVLGDQLVGLLIVRVVI
ncbi:hypothetical protein K9M41_04100 [Candidatus Gracilibacteria bacterium]|nr:hypothetical protein [Candidatus Gracilibacteria bacterium]